MPDYSNVEGLCQIVDESVDAAECGRSKCPEDVLMLRGFSSPKIRRFMNQVNAYGPHTYLEIGTWSGSTFIPALYDNNIKGVSIDNWSQFGPEECNGYDAKKDLNDRLLYYGSHLGQYQLIDRDCFGMTEEERPESNVFLYDGAHEEATTQLGIWHYGKKNKHPFILIVDDIELTPTVKAGCDKALEAFKVEKSWHLKKSDGYHEGQAVFVLSPK